MQYTYLYIYNIANPCGKCGGCPCSSKAQQPKPYSQTKNKDKILRPKIRCHCANNRRTKLQIDQVPIADTYTCSRPRPQAKISPASIAEQCTCKAQAIVKCECPEPPTTVIEEDSLEFADIPARQPTHAKITCGQEIPTTHLYGGSRTSSRHRRHGRHVGRTNSRHGPKMEQHAGPCGHCKTQKKEKSCVIQ